MRLQTKVLTGVILSGLMAAGSVYPAIARPASELESEQLLAQSQGVMDRTRPGSTSDTDPGTPSSQGQTTEQRVQPNASPGGTSTPNTDTTPDSEGIEQRTVPGSTSDTDPGTEEAPSQSTEVQQNTTTEEDSDSPTGTMDSQTEGGSTIQRRQETIEQRRTIEERTPVQTTPAPTQTAPTRSTTPTRTTPIDTTEPQSQPVRGRW